MSYKVGDRVEWEWGNGTARGKITERFTQKVTRSIKGNEVTRKASEDEPAFLIEQEDGDRVLKSVTELRKA
ncbi:hypervirulence associated TUDOR domain-containing protein [Roseivivax sp. CAU 1761]